jgi:hypothetical protein
LVLDIYFHPICSQFMPTEPNSGASGIRSNVLENSAEFGYRVRLDMRYDRHVPRQGRAKNKE